MPTEFDELRVRVWKVGTDRYLVFANGPAAAASSEGIDLPRAAVEEFVHRRDKLLDEEFRRCDPPPGVTEPVRTRLQRLGHRLFQKLFPPPLVQCLEKNLQAAGAQGRGLRLRFHLERDLRDLPVEVLWAPDLELGFLALHPSLAVVRSLPGAEPPAGRLPLPGEQRGALNLLVVVSSPDDQEALTSARDEVRRLRDVDDLHVVDVLSRLDLGQRDPEPVTWAGLGGRLNALRALNAPCAVLLIAHGWFDEALGQGFVYLEGADGRSEPVSGEVLAGQLAGVPGLRLVALNLCQGSKARARDPFSGIANSLISAGVPAVVAMQFDVSDAAASNFSPALFGWVCRDGAVDQAVTQSRRAMAGVEVGMHEGAPIRTLTEWCIPTCLLSDHCRCGWLFKIPQIVVAANQQPPDLYADGDAALLAYNQRGVRVLDLVIRAAQHCRLLGDWSQAARLCRGALNAAPNNALLRGLQREAQVEELVPLVREVCGVLAQDRPPGKGAEDPLARVPGGVFQGLGKEVEEARELDKLYQKARDHERAAEWDLAAAVYGETPGGIRVRRPCGYRDARGRHGYARGRAAEARDQWGEAEKGFAECNAIYPDWASWLAWVRGRAAGQREDWLELLQELKGVAPDHPRPRQQWREYGKARKAENNGDWGTAKSLHQGLKDFEDAPVRAIYSSGREEEEVGNLQAAREAYAKLSEDVFADARGRQAFCDVCLKVGTPSLSWKEAAGLYAIAAPFYNVRAPLFYAQGRAAEQEALAAVESCVPAEVARRWGEATTAYGEAAPELDDARLRLPYARGRHAEAEERWADGVTAYRAAEDGYEDVRRRLPYCQGRAADRDAEWANVIDGFGELEDDYREVGLYRGYARGRVKEQEEAWLAAVEAYRLLPNFRDAGCRMAYCLGRDYEGTGAWRQAAAAYADAQQGYPDAACRRAYCLGRVCEEEGDWEKAADLFRQAVPHADAAGRLAFAQVRAGGERQVWAAVREAYGRLPDDLPADRRAIAQRCDTYAAGRLALEARQWATAEEAFRSLLSDQAEAGRFLAYISAGRAEERSDWAAVCHELDGLPRDWLDVADLAAYAAGRAAEADGLWSVALAAYRGLPSDFRSDVTGRVKRLAALLEQAPWLDGLAHAGLVAHPLAQDDAAFPYRRLAPAGITPGSSNEEIKNASFVLMAKGLMTPEVRVAWDRVRTTSKRLLVDALLYRVEEPAAVRRAQERLPPAPAAVLLRALCQECPANAALFLLLAGQREQAVLRWEEQQRQAPADAALAHRLALAHLGAAADLEARGAFERADPAWERTVAHWVVALSDDAYWAAWRQERSAAYGVAVSGNDMALLRSSLCNHVQQQLAAHADRCASEGRHERAAHFRRLGLAFEVELKGAGVLKEAGGLPLPGAATGLCCGQRFLHLHGLAAALGRRAAELEARLVQPPDEEEDVVAALEKALAETAPETPAGSLTAETLGRLRCVFGRLSEAFILLGRHQPQEALQALPAAALRTTLTNLPPDCGHAAAPADHCPDCRDLAREDPAYLCLPNRGLRRVQDAVKLAEDAHLALAEAALAGGAADLDEPFRHWQAAVAVAFNVRAHVRTKQEITRTVLGRATALQEEEGPQRGERLGHAIELVERARRLIGAADAEQLRAQQAELLTLRGVWFGYGCRHWEFPDYAKAAADLRRALELQPESLTARDNLARALVFEATNLRLDGKARQSWPLVAEALDVLDVGLRPLPDHVRLQKMLQQTLQELETLAGGESLAATLERLDQVLATRPTTAEAAAGRVTALVHEARAKRERGDLSGTILALAEAVRLDPEDAALRGELIAAVKKKMHEK